MHEIAANVALVFGLIVALAGSTDMLLAPQKKDTLARISVRIWYMTDVFLGKSLSVWIERRRTVKYLMFIALFAVALFAGFAFESRDNSSGQSVIKTSEVLAGIILPSCGVGLMAFNWIVRASTPIWALVRATFCLVIFLAPVTLIIAYAVHNKDSLVPHGEVNLEQMLYTISFIFTILSTVVLLAFWLSIAIPVTLIFLLIFALAITEFIARRVAESSKGPLVAFGSLIAVIAAAIKFF